ncbi:uncharacterized protein CDV56_103800 [Aspergillus thermomutatus]|uniref:Uncharacterized protein n=1 Tax=Aspergillus thermomutatus TaxID=41047 RepID=A0A397GLD5_ASPTH|nr:uncharacterized protein CDV56_103800 [Aspergillus thermomutatus]RHZ49893.1 hypothetical protein CDV56_103800 [Aspergillus thermomutatus]
MSSSVHFKFKSQKEPSRVTFDGTGISVFELKREIINQSRLGDGSDFELSIYNEDTGEEYDDDTTIIPRSTSVIARRLPASRPGKGGAARYVSGKMPVSARSTPRNDASISTRAISNTSNALSSSVLELNNAQTEEEKINALFNLQASQWKEQQQEMANATPVPFGRGRGKAVNVPDHPPPPGYLCYRCREKGHWIQACPTNNDPKFDGKYRVKRSTGIPRSLQTKVEKPESLALDGSNEDLRNTGVMVNADGDFVIAKPDKAAWELYQEKAKASSAAAAEAAAAEYSKELQSWGLECPIDKQGVLLDNLSVDDEAVSKIKAYEDEKADSRKETQKNLAVHDSPSNSKGSDSEKNVAAKKELSSLSSVNGALDSASKKRPADENPLSTDHERSNLSPSHKKQKADPIAQAATGSTNPQTQDSSNEVSSITHDQPMPFGFGFMNPQSMPTMPFTETGFIGGGMGFMNPLGLPANGFPNNMNQAWNPMNTLGFDPRQDGIYGSQQNGAMNGYGQANIYSNMGNASMQMMGLNQMAGPMPQNAGFQQGPGEHSGIPEVPSGSKSPSSSPPRSLPVPSPMGSSWPGNQLPEYKGEATYTIPEECERLFCDKLSAIFIGEMKFAQQESPGMDAYQSRPNWTGREKRSIRNWVEVWDYVGDAIYRGFLTDMNDERTLFLFFKNSVLGHNLKAGSSLAYWHFGGLAAGIVYDLSVIRRKVKLGKGFTGRHGRAYLVSAEPTASAVSVSGSSSPTESLPNTVIQRPVPRQFVTGLHTVRDISCAFCGNVLGWKYISAEEESQRYKVGKFILETNRITTSSSWESPCDTDQPVSPGFLSSAPSENINRDEHIEFDSQDEDECEDIFAGIWSPSLAVRRRSRKFDRRLPFFGFPP